MIQDKYTKQVFERLAKIPPEELFRDKDGGPYLRARLVPAPIPGDFADLEWEALHLPTEE